MADVFSKFAQYQVVQGLISFNLMIRRLTTKIWRKLGEMEPPQILGNKTESSVFSYSSFSTREFYFPSNKYCAIDYHENKLRLRYSTISKGICKYINKHNVENSILENVLKDLT